LKSTVKARTDQSRWKSGRQKTGGMRESRMNWQRSGMATVKMNNDWDSEEVNDINIPGTHTHVSHSNYRCYPTDEREGNMDMNGKYVNIL
jgi:hypothetical protein